LTTLTADTGLDLAGLLSGEPRPDPVVAIILDEQCPGDPAAVAAVVARTPQWRIIVVDDGVGAGPWLSDLRAAGVEVITHQRPIGHARCVAAVAALVPGVDLVVLDGDVEVGIGWGAELRRVARAVPDLAGITAHVVPRCDLVACPHLPVVEIARAVARAPRVAVAETATLGRGCVWLTAAGLAAALADLGPTALSAEDVRMAGARRGLRAVSCPRVFTATGHTEPAAWRAARSVDGPDEIVTAIAELRSTATVPPRRLYVVDAGPSRDEAERLRDLTAALIHVQESFVVDWDETGFVLWWANVNNRDTLHTHRGPDAHLALATILINLGVEVVHVDNALSVAGPVLELAQRLGIRTVVTGSQRNSPSHPVTAADVVLVPDVASAQLVQRSGVDPALIRVNEPPPRVDFQLPVRRHRARRNGPLRLVAIAEGDPAAPALLRELAERVGPAVECHLIDDDAPSSDPLVVTYRLTDPGAMRRVLTEIDPDLGLVSDTPGAIEVARAAMFWGLQLPVLSVGEGPTAARISALGGGVHAAAPAGAADQLLSVATDPAVLPQLRAEVLSHPVIGMTMAAERHRAVYDRVTHRTAHPPPRIGYYIKGHRGRHGSCEHIRVLARTAHLDPAQVTVRQVIAADVLHGNALAELDVLLLQDRMLGPDAEPVLAAARRSGVRLVLDLDDDLLDPEALPRTKLTEQEFARMGREVTARLRAADTVLVSTAELADRVADLCHRPPVLVPNHLNPRLWTTEVPEAGPTARKGLRVLYMGTTTHLEDLLLVRPALAEVAARIDVPFTLEVIGVAEEFDGDEWITRLPVPVALQNYPEFVTWLRTRRGRWDLAIAPLVDSRFNAGKSDLKLLEYALLDLPVVASDVGPYRGAEHLARLTENTTAAWTEALLEVLGDRAARRTRAEAARAHVLSHRTITSENMAEWLTTVVGAPHTSTDDGTEPGRATVAEQQAPSDGADAVRYADGAEDAVLATLRAAGDRSAGSAELARSADQNWEMNYHFSPQRLGLLAPLRLTPQTRVADLGCGSGVMSRAMGESGARVIGIEGVRTRAAAARERCADLPNVEIVDGRAETGIEGYSDLDVVLICGLLEYSGVDDPAGPSRLLRAATKALAPDGVLVIAIENQLGLGYLVGRHEDHHNTPWVGMADYPLHRGGPRTWPTRALRAMLAEQGLTELRWFAPYPDYKLPRAVLDADVFDRPDAAELVDKVVRDPLGGAFRGSEALVPGRRLQQLLIGEGLGLSTAPCFLVVCGRSAEAIRAHTHDDLGWMINNGRLPRFRRTRVMTRDLQLRTEGGARTTTVAWLTQRLNGDDVLVPGRPLDALMLEALHHGDEPELHRLLALWHHACARDAKPAPADLTPHPFLCRPGAMMWLPDRLDSHPGNWILTPAGELVQIDDEWRAATGVDAELAALRAMFQFAREIVMGRCAHPYGATADVRTVMRKLCEPLGLATAATERWTDLIEAEAALQHLVMDGPTDTLIAELTAQSEHFEGPRLWDTPGGLAGNVAQLQHLTAVNDSLRQQVTYERRLARRSASRLAKTEAALATSRETAETLRRQAKRARTQLAKVEASRALRVGRVIAAPAGEIRALRRRGAALAKRLRRSG
jgi:precorrin-6B methylase 2